jgi:small subunit ribosomal protein S8
MNHMVSQLVTCLKNGQLAHKDRVTTPSSRLKLSILEILKKDGFIKSFEVSHNGSYNVIDIGLAYNGLQPVIREIKVISKPGRRIYAKTAVIPSIYNGLGMVILSTSQGVITDYDAKRFGVGGELLLKIF